MKTWTTLLTLACAAVLATGCSEARKARRLAAAEKHFQAGDYAKAELEFKAARQLAPMDPQVFKRLGEIYYHQGKHSHAIAFLGKALEVSPGDSEVKLFLGRAKIELGGVRDAHDLASQVLAREPGNVEALLLLADTATPAQFAATGTLLQSAPAAAKASSGWHVAAGMLMAKQRRMDDALKLVTKATEINPDDAVAHQALGTLYFLLKDPAKGLAALKRAFEEAPLRSGIRISYLEVLRRAKGEDEAKTLGEDLAQKVPDFVPVLLFLADMANSQGDRDEAAKLVDKLLSLDPSNLKGLLLKGSVMIANADTNSVGYFERLAEMWRKNSQAPRSGPAGATNQAVAANAGTNEASTAAPEPVSRASVRASTLPPFILQKLGEAYLTVNDQDRALLYLSEAASRDTNSVETATLRDAVLARRGGDDLAAAIDSLEQTVKKAPAYTKARMLLADAYERHGRIDQAIEQYVYLTQSRPKSTEFMVMLAGAYMARTNFDEARKTLEKAMEVEPSSITILEQLTRLDLQQGKPKEAIERLQAQAARQPASAPLRYLAAHTWLATFPQTDTSTNDPAALAGSQAFQQAEVLFLKALEIDPLFRPAVISLADLYVMENRLEPAIGKLAAYSSKTNDMEVLMRLALTQEKAADKEAAAKTYEKLLATWPGHIVALNNLATIYSAQPSQAGRAVELARKALDPLPTGTPLSDAISDTLGWALCKQGDYEGALPYLQRAAASLSDNPEALIHLGLAQYMTGDEPSATNTLRRALQLKADAPNHEQARAALEILAINPSDPAESSLPILERRLASVPGDPAALRRLAASLEKAGQWAKAAGTYEQRARSAKGNANQAISMTKAAEIYAERLGDETKALELAKAARQLDAQNPRLAKLMGRLLFKAGDPQWAATLLEEAVRKSGDPETSYELAMAYYSLGRIPDAERQLKTLADSKQSPLAEQAARTLEFSSAAKDPTHAGQSAAEAQAALKKDPKYLPALYVLAVAQDKPDSAGNALQAYEKVLEQFPTFTPAAKKAILLNAQLGSDERAAELAVKHRDLALQDVQVSEALGLISFKRGDFQAAVRQLQTTGITNAASVASLQIARHRVGQRVDAAALQAALKAGLPKTLEAQAKEALAGVRPGGN